MTPKSGYFHGDSQRAFVFQIGHPDWDAILNILARSFEANMNQGYDLCKEKLYSFDAVSVVRPESGGRKGWL